MEKKIGQMLGNILWYGVNILYFGGALVLGVLIAKHFSL